MRTLLVAERFNIGARWSHADKLIAGGRYERWLQFSMDVGAYGTGMTERNRRNDIGKNKLRSIGCRYDRALNMLPPGPVSAWELQAARLVADELRRLIVTAHEETHLDMEPRFAEWLFDRVILVGKRVAAAMEADVGFFEPIGGCIVVPHPSGRNLWWNNAQAIAHGRAKMEGFLCGYSLSTDSTAS